MLYINVTMAPLSMKQDPKKNPPAKTQAKPVSVKLTMVKQPVDSLKLANDEIDQFKGKKIDPTKASDKNKRMLRLMSSHVIPEIHKHKEKADSVYSYNKAKDPNYPGVSAKELDKVTKNEGKKFISYAKTYSKYRDVTDVVPSLKGTPMSMKEKPQSRFGGTNDNSKEDLYVPDMRMSTPKKKAAALKVTKPK